MTRTRWTTSRLFWFLKKDLRPNGFKKKRKRRRRQLFRTYCIFIIHKQRVSGRSMLCQSVLKHLRHSSSVMKSVKKRGIWQNVLRTLFYHKCFVSQSFLQGRSLTRNYKSVWIFDGRRNRFCLYWKRQLKIFSLDKWCYLYPESYSFKNNCEIN